MNKLEKLRFVLRNMGSLLVAYSGGVDSTFLLKVAKDALQDKVLAVTADSLTFPKEELVFSKQMTKALGVKHKIIKTNELKDKKFVSNPVNRCYFCKRELFGRLRNLASKYKLNFVADASNVSDKKDFRPGNKAKEIFKIRSPLQEAGFTKQDIRTFSRSLGLTTWDKPSLACLASRIPYGIKIKPQLLKRINIAESYLKKMEFKQVRIRDYDNGLCRIEVPKEDIPVLFNRRSFIVEKLKRLGYNYITVDLEGYRSGSLNPSFNRKRSKKR